MWRGEAESAPPPLPQVESAQKKAHSGWGLKSERVGETICNPPGQQSLLDSLTILNTPLDLGVLRNKKRLERDCSQSMWLPTYDCQPKVSCSFLKLTSLGIKIRDDYITDNGGQCDTVEFAKLRIFTIRRILRRTRKVTEESRIETVVFWVGIWTKKHCYIKQ